MATGSAQPVAQRTRNLIDESSCQRLQPAPAARPGALLRTPAGAPGRRRQPAPGPATRPALRLGPPVDRPHLAECGLPGPGTAQRATRGARHRPVCGRAATSAGPGATAVVPRPIGHPAPVVQRLPPGAAGVSRLSHPPGAKHGRLASDQPAVPIPRHAAGGPGPAHATPPGRAGVLAGRRR
ncbi:hypothetical protein D3C81_1389090 [compost metagenome]